MQNPVIFRLRFRAPGSVRGVDVRGHVVAVEVSSFGEESRAPFPGRIATFKFANLKSYTFV